MVLGQKIASLYAEIGADTSKLEEGLQKTKRGLDGAKTNFSGVGREARELGKTFAVVGASAAAIGFASKQIYDLGRAGAELTSTRDSFDKLSVSINTTSDALLKDLKRATRGMYSEAELVSSATELMGLGFADSHDEAVRLTRVAAGLNMNMQQLSLTLANETTARFDTLNVKAAGFEDVLAEVAAEGVATDKVFKEAFLRQAEKQLELVGDAADKDIASFVRLEKTAQNLADNFKKSLVPALSDVANAVNNYIEDGLELERTQRKIDDAYKAGLITWYESGRLIEDLRWKKIDDADATELLNQKIHDSFGGLDRYQAMNERAAKEIAAMEKAQQDANAELAKAPNIAGKAAEQYNKYSMEAYEAASATRELEDANLGAAMAITNVSKAALGQDALEALTQAYNDGKISAEEFESGQRNILTQWLGMSSTEAEAGIALARLKKDFEDGLIPVEAYYRGILGIGTELDYLNGKTFRTTYVLTTEGYIPQAQSSGATGESESIRYHSGGSFVVPAGYPNDTFVPNIRLSSGERVDIKSAGEVSDGAGGGGSRPITVNIMGDATRDNAALLARQIGAELDRQARYH